MFRARMLFTSDPKRRRKQKFCERLWHWKAHLPTQLASGFEEDTKNYFHLASPLLWRKSSGNTKKYSEGHEKFCFITKTFNTTWRCNENVFHVGIQQVTFTRYRGKKIFTSQSLKIPQLLFQWNHLLLIIHFGEGKNLCGKLNYKTFQLELICFDRSKQSWDCQEL